MISLIQSQVVGKHGWLSEGAFTDIVAISQTTPGPVGVNCATYTGFEVFHNSGYGIVAGVLGSAIATFAIVLPSFILFFLILKLFIKFHEKPAFLTGVTALKPAVAGLIGAAAMVLIFNIGFGEDGFFMHVQKENFIDWKSWLLFCVAFVLSYFKNVGPIRLILGSALLGLLIY